MIQTEQHGPVTAIRMARGFLGRPLYWATAYFVDGLLIDAGPRCTAPALLKVLAQVDLQQVVVTHGHEDHIGGLAAIRRRYPTVPIYAPPRTLAYLETPAKLGMQRYRRLFWGMPKAVTDAHSLHAVDDLVQTPNHTFRVVETPGHSDDHVSYFEPGYRWLFSGDAFLGGRDTAWTPDFDLFGILGSLRTLADLRPERLFPASGNVRRTPVPDLHEKITYLTDLAREVARLDAAGATDAEMVAFLFHDEPAIHYWTFGHFSARHLIASCRTYNAIRGTQGAPESPSPTTPNRMTPDSTDSPGQWPGHSTGHRDLLR